MDFVDNTGRPYESVEVDDDGNFTGGVRQDGLHDMPIDLDIDTWGILGLQAHDLDITLNEHLINIIMCEVANTDGITLTPDRWLQYHKDFDGITIMDPDGWDRNNYVEDWAKLLTKEEMQYKVNQCTVTPA
jgi:hypothetical protein